MYVYLLAVAEITANSYLTPEAKDCVILTTAELPGCNVYPELVMLLVATASFT
jgi:hypothetical protein